MSSANKSTKPSEKARKIYSAPALEKGLDLLELLAVEPNGLNISQITNKLNKSVGELFRMLVVLEQRGYVEMMEGTDKYRLTLQLFKLTNRFPPIKNLNNIAGPEMERLSYEIEQSCHLVIYYEGKGHVIAQQDPPSERIFSVRVGAEVPLISTCSGHILLAFADQDKRLKMIAKIPAHHTQPKQGVYEQVIDKVSTQGYESIPSAQAHGVRDIGFPIFDNNNTVVAVLAVPFLEYLDGSHKRDFDGSLDIIKQTALRISNKLGFHGSE